MTYFLLILGFVFLIQGGAWLVDGSRALAVRLGVSELLIGLTIVAMGTSMPEFIVSLLAALQGNAELAIGNVLGSNIANVLLILGASAAVRSLPVHRNTILSEIPFSIAAALLLGFLVNTTFGYEAGALALSRGDGAIVLFFFLLFMAYIVMLALEEKQQEQEAEVEVETRPPLWQSWIRLAFGVAGLFVGGRWVVDGASAIAFSLGMSQAFVGLTVVAVGTSLPELVTSIMAARGGNTDIAVGNIVGSNLFNILFVLGMCAVIQPLPFAPAANTDLLVVIAASSLIPIALIAGRRLTVSRLAGWCFLGCYIAYMFFLIQRG